MRKLGLKTVILLGMMAISTVVKAQPSEVVVGDDKTSNLAIGIYNNNFAFVKDTRSVSFNMGENLLAFEGVAKELQPASVRIKAAGVEVLEQNYDYNILSYVNLVQAFAGKKVKTVVQNPITGENVFGTAKLLSSEYGTPVLEFDYGIDPAFPGRIVFDGVPENMRKKPTMIASLKSADAGIKDVEIAYLTRGISWKADYVADVNNDNTFDLRGFITLTNNSGVDYKNAFVQLIAGNVNLERGGGVQPAPRMMAKSLSMDTFGGAVNESMPAHETMSSADYHLYSLPLATTIKDKQTKQVALLSKQSVKFEKKYELHSPLGLYFHSRESEFLKQNPTIAFKIVNRLENNLGLPLPSGLVRFYEKDSKGNAQFMGESRIEQTAVGQEAELSLGQSFDVFVSGKISEVREISKEIREFSVEIEFNNAKDEDKKVEFLQNIGNHFELLSFSIPSVKKNANTLKWVVDLPAKEKATLRFEVRVFNK